MRERKRRLRNLAMGAGVVSVGIQLVPVPRDNPPVVRDVGAPAEVEAILRRACYDCHSNETVWPWYAYVAPVSWLVANDVRRGRKHLNFSDWGRKRDARDEIWEEVSEGDMPMAIYLPLHPEARLSDADKAAIRAWALPGGRVHGDDDGATDEHD